MAISVKYQDLSECRLPNTMMCVQRLAAEHIGALSMHFADVDED